MPSEVQRIPPAPRRVALRRVLGYRWPLLVLTFVLFVYGGLITWMFFLASSGIGEDAERLAKGPLVRVTATVTAASPAAGRDAQPRRQQVDYAFHTGGQNWTGEGEVAAGTFGEGHPIEIEHLAGEPRLNRIVGGVPPVPPTWLDPANAFALVVVPGFLIGLCYLAGVFHLRQVLAHGDVALAQVTTVARVRFCLPESFAVAFRFRDHRAEERRGRHWVRAHSPLGERLLTMLRHGAMDKVPVLHDRRHPQHCRLVLPDDFQPDGRPVDPAATIRL